MSGSGSVAAPADLVIARGHNLGGGPRDTVAVDLPDAAFVTVDAAAELDRRGAWARCVQGLGALDAAVEYSVAHTREREQFGRPLSAFQAVQHTLASMAGEVERARAAAELAVAAAAEYGFGSTQTDYAVTVAKVVLGRAVPTVVTAAHQLHGAIGVTIEHRLWLATMRARGWVDEFGDTATMPASWAGSPWPRPGTATRGRRRRRPLVGRTLPRCRQLAVCGPQPQHGGQQRTVDHLHRHHRQDDRECAGDDNEQATFGLAQRATVGRVAPAPAAASAAKVGSVDASAASSTMITGQDSQCMPGPPCRAAHTASPAKASTSGARSPTSLMTKPTAIALGGTRHRPVEVGARQAQHHEHRRQRPASQPDGHGARTRRHHARGGEHIRRDPSGHGGVDNRRQDSGEPGLQRVEAEHPPRLRWSRRCRAGAPLRQRKTASRPVLTEGGHGGSRDGAGARRRQPVGPAALGGGRRDDAVPAQRLCGHCDGRRVRAQDALLVIGQRPRMARRYR